MPYFGSPGRLAQSTDSGAGKRRIFAIGNYVNQRLLKQASSWLVNESFINFAHGWDL